MAATARESYHKKGSEHGEKWRMVLAIVAIVANLAVMVISAVGSIQFVNKPFQGFRLEPTLTVSAIQDPNWTGTKAGLQQFDRLLQVNGQPTRSTPQVEALIRSLPVGSQVTYDMLRSGVSMRVTVPTQPFRWSDWLASFFPIYLAGLLHLLVGTMAFLMRPTNRITLIHLAMNLAICFFCVLANDYDASRFAPQLSGAAAILLGATSLHLGLVFPVPLAWLERRHWLIPLLYSPLLVYFTVIPALLNGWQANIDQVPLSLYLSFYNSSPIYMVLGILGLVAAIAYRIIRPPSSQALRQAKVAVVGAAIAYLPGILLWAVPFILGTSLDQSGRLVNTVYLCLWVFPLSISYAIVKHRLFDIDMVIKRTVTYTVVVAALTGVYLLCATGLRAAIEVMTGASNSSWGTALATAVVALLFAPLRDRTKFYMDRLFFRGSYDFRKVLREYELETRTARDLGQAMDLFLDRVDRTLKPEFLTIYLSSSDGNLEAVRHIGRVATADPSTGQALLSFLGSRPSHVGSVPWQGLEQAVALPLSVHGSMLGCVLIGPRKSHLDYEEQDIQLLANFAQNLEFMLQQQELMRQEAEASRVRGLLSRYVSEQVAETVLQNNFNLEAGRRQQVTVMFTDIRGFTQMSEAMPPEDVVALLNSYFSHMVDIVFSSQGTLDKYIGDGMMIVFGAPIPYPDHAYSAVQAALKMRSAMEAFNAHRQKEGKLPLKIGIGIHTGECIIGNIGTVRRLDYTAIGDTVNTASRIESLTKEKAVDILISAETYAEVRDRVIARSIPGVSIRGKASTLDLFALEGLLQATPNDQSPDELMAPTVHGDVAAN